MVDLISGPYVLENRALHERDGYGASGHYWLGHVLEIADAFECRGVLDYGAGKGSLGDYVRRYGLGYTAYDPATFPEPPTGRYDLVACLDVLEHVEPDLIDAVLDHIAAHAGKAVLLVVSTRPATKTLSDGRNAHLLVQPYDWWKRRLEKRWLSIRVRQHADTIEYLGLPRRGVPVSDEQIVALYKGNRRGYVSDRL